jgi:hypothetical protein
MMANRGSNLNTSNNSASRIHVMTTFHYLFPFLLRHVKRMTITKTNQSLCCCCCFYDANKYTRKPNSQEDKSTEGTLIRKILRGSRLSQSVRKKPPPHHTFDDFGGDGSGGSGSVLEAFSVF